MCPRVHFSLCLRTALIYDQDSCPLFTQTSMTFDEPKSTFFYCILFFKIIIFAKKPKFLTPKNQSNLITSVYFILDFHSTFLPYILRSFRNGLRLCLTCSARRRPGVASKPCTGAEILMMSSGGALTAM